MQNDFNNFMEYLYVTGQLNNEKKQTKDDMDNIDDRDEDDEIEEYKSKIRRK